MAGSISPRARIIIGATTVVTFLVAGLSLLSTQPVLSGLLLLLASLRFLLLLQQIRAARRRARTLEKDDRDLPA